MKTKDFLFFNYNWVPNSTFIFESFRKLGHEIDIIGEEQLRNFQPDCKYKNVVLYLHEGWSIPITNHIIDNYCQDSFLIQHDDTDFEQLQKWSNRTPDLFMQREYTCDTDLNNLYFANSKSHSIDKRTVKGFHFPMDSLYNKDLQEKKWDICFIGRPTNAKRQSFINKITELSKNSLSHLKWYIQYDYVDQKDIDNRRNKLTHDYYKEVINGSKIGLNSPGNSFDSHRNWELASCGSCIIQPKLKVKSCDSDHMLFDNYIKINDNHSDLEEKILYALENDRWREIGQRAFDDYNSNHTPEKCFEYYYNTLMKYANK